MALMKVKIEVFTPMPSASVGLPNCRRAA